MRRLVAALLVVLVALTLVGCGGGEEDPAATTPPPAPAPAPAAEPAEDLGPIPDRSAEESAVFEPFPLTEDVPTELAKAIGEKRPTIILFIDSAQKDTNDIKSEVNAVVEDNQGLVDLFVYDLGKYASVRPDGTIVVESDDLNADATAKSAVRLAQELEVNFTPYIFVTDDQGYMIYKHSGYLDRELLGAQVQRVTD